MKQKKQFIFYPLHGIGTIENKKTYLFTTQTKEYFKITIERTEVVIYVPEEIIDKKGGSVKIFSAHI